MINTRKTMHPGDCYLYENDCTCGKTFGGWTPDEADNNFAKHIYDVKGKVFKDENINKEVKNGKRT